MKLLMERYEKKRSAIVPTPAKQYTAARGQMNTNPRQNTSTVASTSASASGGANASIDLNTIRCFNCFSFGHYQSACSAPKRPPTSCFICSEQGHTRHNCPKKKKPTDGPNAQAVSDSTASVAAAVQQMTDEEAEVRRLAAKLNNHNLVSIAFFKQNECTELISRIALFDNGS